MTLVAVLNFTSKFFGRRKILFGIGFLLALFYANVAEAQITITVHPESQNVSANSTVTFSATAETLPQSNLTFQWKRNGANIPGALTFIPISGGTAAYSITNVQPRDGGSYSVVVYNSTGAFDSSNALLIVTNVPVFQAKDIFSQALSIGTNSGGNVRTDNFGATKENNEPNHGYNPGGSSVWVRWTAPISAIATFDTLGSAFDTTLGIYTGTNVTGLITNIVGESDDEAGFYTSKISFNALQGKTYSIAIDGYYGDQGNIVLNWSLSQFQGIRIPEIFVQPQSKTAFPNETFQLSVIANTTNVPPIFYQWFRDGQALINETKSNIVIQATGGSIVGDYQVVLQFNGSPSNTFSTIAHVQINSNGDSKAAAQDKFREATDPISGPQGFSLKGEGVPKAAPASGFTGTQTFSTATSFKEPGEPNPCGEAGGSSYWYTYLATNNGILTVDVNCNFNGFMGIYTAPGYTFQSCNSTNNGPGHEVASCPAASGTIYNIVVDGVGGANGMASLTYTLIASPTITSNPPSRTVPQGSNVTLNVTATGSPTLGYQWRTNGMKFLNRTSTNLTVTNFQSINQGNYDVIVTNTAGAATSSVAILYLNSPLRFTNTLTTTNSFAATLLGVATTNYVIQASTNLATTNWVPIRTNVAVNGIITFTETNVMGYSNRFYRAIPK